MKVIVLGATGRVATVLIEKLLGQGHEVLAACRQPERLAEREGLVPVQMDLHARPEQIAQLMADVDAVYFTAGSRGKDLLQTDAYGAIKSMQASQLAGVKRYIMLSSAFALEPEKWDGHYGSLQNYQIAKYLADHWLVHNSHLDYTIIQPGPLTEDEETGMIETKLDQPAANAIANVAEVLAQSLAIPETMGKVIVMADGQEPIHQALRNA